LVPEVSAVIAVNKADQIKRVRSSPLRTIRTMTWVMGGISGVLVLIADRLPDITRFLGQDPNLDAMTETFFAVSAVILGAAGFVLQMIAERVDRVVDTYLAELDDYRFCAAELAKHLEYKDVATFTEASFAKDSATDTSSSLLLGFGGRGSKLIPLVLLKAREHGLIDIARPLEVTPDSVAEFTVKFRPSAFAPKAQPPPPPPTTADALPPLIVGVAGFILFLTVTVYLVLIGRYFWALLPGFLALSMSGLTMAGVTELHRARLSKKTNHE